MCKCLGLVRVRRSKYTLLLSFLGAESELDSNVITAANYESWDRKLTALRTKVEKVGISQFG